MNFDTLSYESSLDSDDDNNLYDHISKTKSQPTKFFNDLNRHQKFLSRKMVSQNENYKKSNSNRKHQNRSPTFKEMIMASKKYIDDQSDFSYQVSKMGDSYKKKVRFDNHRQSQEDTRFRKPSIQKNAGFNFYESIKQMALQLTESKKNCQDVNAQDQKNQKSNQSLFSGYTQKQFQDGTKFKGICENGVIIKGQLHFSNGFVYEGQLFLDKFHGKGKLTLPKQQVIQADWIQGEIVGKATIRYPKGQIYYGDLKNFRRHGKGHLFFNDGSKYEGQFNQGQLTGYGVHITTSGEKTSGYWFYGDFVGTNEQVFENVMENVAAHQKKKTQKQHNNIKYSKRRSSRKSQNLFAELFANMDSLS